MFAGLSRPGPGHQVASGRRRYRGRLSSRLRPPGQNFLARSTPKCSTTR
jgi:hypothetical protein